MWKFFLVICMVGLLSSIVLFANDYKKGEINVAMTCKSCKNTIEKTLKSTEGIKKVNADVKSQLVKVEYDDTKISLKKIVEIINDLGYKASAKTEKLDDAQTENLKSSGCFKRCDS